MPHELIIFFFGNVVSCFEAPFTRVSALALSPPAYFPMASSSMSYGSPLYAFQPIPGVFNIWVVAVGAMVPKAIHVGLEVCFLFSLRTTLEDCPQRTVEESNKVEN